MRAAIYVLIVAAAFAAGWYAHPEVRRERSVEVLRRIDTVRVVQPEVLLIKQLAPVAEALPAVGTHDTVLVEVPRTQVVYEQPDFRAYVSGFRPALDSIEVYRHSTTIEMPRCKAPRFSVGLQAGYGYTPRGFQPFIGIGVSVNIASF
ncbi:MAG: hypothetical protein NC418_00765 [Muribaculaceae bacterium]|nr:hypothetical protein [Muribaculaceae bacterium]